MLITTVPFHFAEFTFAEFQFPKPKSNDNPNPNSLMPALTLCNVELKGHPHNTTFTGQWAMGMPHFWAIMRRRCPVLSPVAMARDGAERGCATDIFAD